ncbi:MAG: SPOR domain-containing protein [Wenzhouxiangella sp.]|jgi:DedD protein|nr:SPOR domain-containing protein [Wenzhouxiangella sp.]
MDKVLKQRLVGAAILIALAVIFVPMLFDGPNDREGPRDASIDLPPPPADRREVRRLPLQPVDLSEPAAADLPEPQAPPEPLPSAETVDPAETVVETVTEPSPAPAPQDPAEPEPAPPQQEPEPPQTAPPEPEPPAPVAGGWQVQVASFSSSDTAQRIVAQLEQLGHVAGLDPLVRGDTRLYRVWTGPYGDRELAERARAQIAATVAGVEPMVRELPGSGESVDSMAAQSGFAVQVGSFAEQSNADRQRSQLIERGFDAFIHADETGSRPIWRVRVGLFDTREPAVALQRTLREQAGLEGLVVSHP